MFNVFSCFNWFCVRTMKIMYKRKCVLHHHSTCTKQITKLRGRSDVISAKQFKVLSFPWKSTTHLIVAIYYPT